MTTHVINHVTKPVDLSKKANPCWRNKTQARTQKNATQDLGQTVDE